MTVEFSQGVELVLTADTPCIPIWLEKEQMEQYKQLRVRIISVTDIQKLIERFNKRQDTNDNTLSFTYKEAAKDAKEYDEKLTNACKELNDACIESLITVSGRMSWFSPQRQLTARY